MTKQEFETKLEQVLFPNGKPSAEYFRYWVEISYSSTTDTYSMRVVGKNCPAQSQQAFTWTPEQKDTLVKFLHEQGAIFSRVCVLQVQGWDGRTVGQKLNAQNMNRLPFTR